MYHILLCSIYTLDCKYKIGLGSLILIQFSDEILDFRSLWLSAAASVGWILGRCCSGKGSIHSSESSNDDQDAHQKKVAVYATTTQLLEFSRGPLADTIKRGALIKSQFEILIQIFTEFKFCTFIVTYFLLMLWIKKEFEFELL